MAGSKGTRVSEEAGLLDLMRKVQGGDQAALAALFDATHRRLHGHAMRLLRDEAHADDVVVETFARVWRLAARFDPARGSLMTWMLTLTSRISIDLLRRSAVRPSATTGQGDRQGEVGEGGRELEDSAADPSRLTSEAEGRHRIRNAVRGLPERQRVVIEAAFFGGLTHSEIAETMGEALGTIKSRIRAGLIALRQVLEPGEVGLS